MPALLVDAYYPGAFDVPSIFGHHHCVLMVAGGGE